MARGKSKTGDPDPFTVADVDELYDELIDSFDDELFDDLLDEEDQDDEAEILAVLRALGLDNTGLTVTGDIQWAGAYNPSSYRTTRLEGLDLVAVYGALVKVRQLEDKAVPLKSYNDVGWYDKLHRLTDTQHGRTALAEAGFSPRRLGAWLSGAVDPRTDNVSKIEKVYEDARMRNVEKYGTAAEQAKHVVAERFHAALRDQYGAEIRIFNPDDFELG